jgi:hypothetical protein
MPSGPRRRKTSTPPDMNLVLNVTKYSARIYPGQSSDPPDDLSGTALGYVILAGDASAKGLQFVISFFPNGSNLQQSNFDAGANAVQMEMNWCQFEPLMNLLAAAFSAQALFSLTNGIPWSDVEGQYTRKNSSMKPR